MKNPSILVLEDDPVLRKVTAELLAYDGYEPLLAGNVQQALALLEQHCPKWALVDFQLKDGDGLDFLQAARVHRHGCAQGLKVIAVTGWGTAPGRLGQFLAEADHRLQKPIDWARLTQIITQAKS